VLPFVNSCNNQVNAGDRRLKQLKSRNTTV
jgi:hypothetical protein